MTATGDYTKQVHINRPRGRCSPHLRPRRSSAPGGRQPPDPQPRGELRLTFDGIDGPLVLRVGKPDPQPA